MEKFILISCGGFLGAVCRCLLDNTIKQKRKTNFPLETLLVNITGSFILGVIYGLDVSAKDTYLFLN